MAMWEFYIKFRLRNPVRIHIFFYKPSRSLTKAIPTLCWLLNDQKKYTRQHSIFFYNSTVPNLLSHMEGRKLLPHLPLITKIIASPSA